MYKILLPQKPIYTPIDEQSGKFEILGCYPGYGTTLGNSIRRVLLSSLEGAAITSVKIKGVSHEFSTVKGVKEDVIQIILNLKKIRFKMHTDETVVASVKVKGEKKITAKDIKCPSSAEVVNTDQEIAVLTSSKEEFEMEIEINKGLGYVPVEQQERDEVEIGKIAVDAIYTPIKRVNYNVENMRVGKRTDFEKITLEIVTDGSINPKDAYEKSVAILVEQFSAITDWSIEKEKVEEKVEEKKEVVEEVVEKYDPTDTPIVELKNISTRTLNVLQSNNIEKVRDIVNLTEAEVNEMEGMGEKGIKEIKKSIGVLGLTLKSK